MISGIAAAFLVSWLFWSGIAIGGVVFAALLDLTGAQWSEALRATAQRFWRFLPLSLAAYVVLIRLLPERHGRDVFAIVGTYATAVWFAYSSARVPSRRARSAVVLVIIYAAGFSVVAHDLLMSIGPRAVSTLFPAYVLTANVYGGIGASAFMVLTRRDRGSRAEAGERRDIAMVLIGMALMWIYLLWSQFLVIWYGNLPDETRYIVQRTTGWWPMLMLAIVVVRLVLPGVVLPVTAARTRAVTALVCAATVAGFWAEYMVLVAPGASTPPSIPLAGLLTVALGGAFVVVLLPRRIFGG